VKYKIYSPQNGRSPTHFPFELHDVVEDLYKNKITLHIETKKKGKPFFERMNEKAAHENRVFMLIIV